MLPHKGDGGLRIEGEDQQIQPPQIVEGSRKVDRSARERTVEDGGVAVKAPDGAVGVFRNAFAREPPINPSPPIPTRRDSSSSTAQPSVRSSFAAVKTRFATWSN